MTRDLRAERADVVEATRNLEAEYKRQLAAFDQRTAGTLSPADERVFSDLQHAYNRAKFAALYPLAARGNSVAIYNLSGQYKWADSGFDDDTEWLRIQTCASDLGNPEATVENMRWHWHNRGDGTIGAVQRNRATALELAEKAADEGDMGGIVSIAVYIAGNVHQYPANPALAGRLFVLCEDAGIVLGEPWQRDLAKQARPGGLVGEAIARPTRQPTSWRELKPDWARIEAQILAYGDYSPS